MKCIILNHKLELKGRVAEDETYSSFLARFGQTLAEDAEVDKTIHLVLPEDRLAQTVALMGGTPFANNRATSVIVKVPEECDHFSFTEDEMIAMMAHELGHLLDNTRIESPGCMEMEVNADHFAVILGLKDALSFALQKMIATGDFSEQEEKSMRSRIEILNNQ